MRTPTIALLTSGGIIANYYCSSRCAHCLYACSPNWEKKYISSEKSVELFHKIKLLGCGSVHIGGGEPFLDIEGLLTVCLEAQSAGMRIDYIETNSSWYKSEALAEDKLCIKLISVPHIH